MTVIDKILNEWAYRCSDGVVSLDDPQKVKILFEIIKPMLKEDIDDDILNVLVATDTPTKEKVLRYLQRIGDPNDNEKLEVEVAKLLKPKLGRNDLIEQVIFIADSKQFEVLSELRDYLKNPTVTYNDLISNTNLNDLFSPTGFSQEFIDKIINIKGSAQPSLGKGEVAFTVFLKDTYKGQVGDVVSSGKPIEIKSSGAKVMDKDITIGSKAEIQNNPKFKILTNQYGEYMNGRSWVEYIQSAYDKVPSKNQYLNEVNSLLNDLYPKANVEIKDEDMRSVEAFNKKIAVSIAKDYLKDQNILFLNPETKDYIYIQGYEDYVKKIYDNTLFAKNASDKIPRIYY